MVVVASMHHDRRCITHGCVYSVIIQYLPSTMLLFFFECATRLPRKDSGPGNQDFHQALLSEPRHQTHHFIFATSCHTVPTNQTGRRSTGTSSASRRARDLESCLTRSIQFCREDRGAHLHLRGVRDGEVSGWNKVLREEPGEKETHRNWRKI